MLRKFSVENFKCFQGKFVLDLSKPGNYAFNHDCIKDGVVGKAAIYGINGIGKSNFGLALFDIINHLTDKFKEPNRYNQFINRVGVKPYAFFEYEFQFGDSILTYNYSKLDVDHLVTESLSINGTEMLYYNFQTKDGFSLFEGSETLNLSGESGISRVKYVMNTALLSDNNKNNNTLKAFRDFVNKMLFFSSLRTNMFIGFRSGGDSIEKIIIEANRVKDFEEFLNGQGLKLKLDVLNISGVPRIVIQYRKSSAPYFDVCSTGMSSLILLYSWLITLGDCSFVYIDEFDAFYHYELAETIIKELKKYPNTQIIVSTHNTDLMNNDLMRPDCYYVLTDEKIDSLNHLTEKDLRFAHNLQKMFKEGAFEEDSK